MVYFLANDEVFIPILKKIILISIHSIHNYWTTTALQTLEAWHHTTHCSSDTQQLTFTPLYWNDWCEFF